MFKAFLKTAFFAFTILISTSQFAAANGCGSGARALVSGNANATLLSVSAQKASNGSVTCVARIKLAAKNGQPPRVVVRRFKP